MGDEGAARDGTFHILTVCTMNICRSPALEALLSDALATEPIDVSVSSAGTKATVSAPRCAHSLAGTGLTAPVGDARAVTKTDVVESDLIVTADRDHASAILQLVPAARDKTFPVRQAARLAAWVVAAGPLAAAVDKAEHKGVAEEFQLVPALPAGSTQRARWLVSEMSASRGLAPTHAADGDDGGLDIPDPHVLGDALHEQSVRLCVESVRVLTTALGVVLAAGHGPAGQTL